MWQTLQHAHMCTRWCQLWASNPSYETGQGKAAHLQILPAPLRVLGCFSPEAGGVFLTLFRGRQAWFIWSKFLVGLLLTSIWRASLILKKYSASPVRLMAHDGTVARNAASCSRFWECPFVTVLVVSNTFKVAFSPSHRCSSCIKARSKSVFTQLPQELPKAWKVFPQMQNKYAPWPVNILKRVKLVEFPLLLRTVSFSE